MKSKNESLEKMNFREIIKEDDRALAAIIRYNLKKHGMDIPGTAYFDESLSSLSEYYHGDNGRSLNSGK